MEKSIKAKSKLKKKLEIKTIEKPKKRFRTDLFGRTDHELSAGAHQ